MPLTPGSRLGPYEITAPLGAGGMGEVYRARDPRLDRDVAIKVLPEALIRDAERLARFEREARVLAGLGHSGIAALFGVEDAGGHPALVMELVEGPTLADRILHGPMPPDEVLGVGRQLAEALEYAHDHGIVHRDLKPANVKLRPDGAVKVLDFGLARALESEPGGGSGDLSRSPTITQRMTTAGMILGTAAYMAPEQARGRPADRRADVWAFGAMLYEMLTGGRAFGGETISDTLASVMRDEPDWSALPPGLAPRWRRLLERCLTKDPRRRLQAIGEARIALEELAADPEGSADAAPAPARPERLRTAILPWAVAAASLAALVFVALGRKAAPTPGITEVSVVPPMGLRVAGDLSYHPMALSPDARTLAYTVRVGGVLKMRLRRLDSGEDVELSGTDGARNFFFSPDGQWIGFFDSRKLSKISVRGGTPVELADALQDRLGTWLEDGTIVYSREVTEPLYRIPDNGGPPVALTTLDSTRRERTHRFPCALDGGPWVVFTVQTVDSPGGYDDASIDAVSVKTGERRHLFKGARRAVWAPGGYLILARGSDLYAVPIDPRDPRITRDPVPVLGDVSGDGSSGSSNFSIADDGTLAWIRGGGQERSREVGWFDRAGRWTPSKLPPGEYGQLKLSPDGSRALITTGPGGGNSDVWLADLRSGAMTPLTQGGRGGYAAWLPGGNRIAYSGRDSTSGERVYVLRLDGAEGVREIARAPFPLVVTDVTLDGKGVVYADYGQRTGRIRIAAVDGAAPAREIPGEGSGYEQAGMISPDGRWLAYISNKSRREEVCLRRFPAGGGSWQLSTGQAGGIRWGRDARELFFVTGEVLHRLVLDTSGEAPSFVQPEPLFEVPPTPTESSFRDYDYDRVNDRFLFTRPPRALAERREIDLSLGWSGRLAEKLRGARASGR